MTDQLESDKRHKAKLLAERYDELPYYGSPQEELHVSRLAALAKLFDIKTAPVEQCRFLSLGCGDAANMIPMALSYPDSEFIGVDLAKRETDRAHEMIDALSLGNIDIRHFDILDIDNSFGKFDYITAHGVYSWVPEAVREKVLAVCRENLSEDGIALVSYNCQPGFQPRDMVRMMLVYHVAGITDVRQMVAEAREYLKTLARASNHKTAYGQFLRELAEEVKNYSDNFFRHDLLGDINHPVYFHQFVSALQKHNLQYVTEADFHSVIKENYSHYAQECIENVSGNYIVKEQHLDFIQGRQFRQSILCHAEKFIRRDLDKTQLENMYFTSQLKLGHVLDGSTESQVFHAKDGVDLKTSDPVVRHLWRLLAENWPKPRSFDFLLEALKRAVPQNSNKIKDVLIQHLLRGVKMGFINMYSCEHKVNSRIEDKPEVNPMVRYQAGKQLWVTNQLNQKIAIDNMTHHILPLLDGGRDQDAVLDGLYQLVLKGKINLNQGGKNLVDEEQVKAILRQQLEKLLPAYRNSALLI